MTDEQHLLQSDEQSTQPAIVVAQSEQSSESAFVFISKEEWQRSRANGPGTMQHFLFAVAEYERESGVTGADSCTVVRCRPAEGKNGSK